MQVIFILNCQGNINRRDSRDANLPKNTETDINWEQQREGLKYMIVPKNIMCHRFYWEMTKEKTITSTIRRECEMNKNISSNKYCTIKANRIRILNKIFGKNDKKYELTSLVKLAYLQRDGWLCLCVCVRERSHSTEQKLSRAFSRVLGSSRCSSSRYWKETRLI